MTPAITTERRKMKRAIRSLALVLAAVAGLVAFTPTEASADHYWGRTYHRNVTHRFAYHDSYGRPVYVNESGHHFRHGHRGRHIYVSRHHGGFVSRHHDHGHGHHRGLFRLLFGH
jgi:hypothetical protein